MTLISRSITSVVFVGMGLLGLYFKVDYSGWIVFIGVLIALLA